MEEDTRLLIPVTAESVTEGHPDKVADRISDAVLDACLEQDPMSRVACETPGFLPMPLHLAHRLTRRLAEVRKDGAPGACS